MGERHEQIIREIVFDSVFSIEELYNVVEVYFKEKNYDKWEKYAHEYKRKDSTEIHTETRYLRPITDYFLLMEKIKYNSRDLKRVKINRYGKEVEMVKGKISMIFEGSVVTDYDNKFGETKAEKPLWQFIKDLFDTFVYNREKQRYAKQIVNDTNEAIELVYRYFNFPAEKGGTIRQAADRDVIVQKEML